MCSSDLSEVIDTVRKSVIEVFVPSRQYKTWLTNRFPLPEDPEPEEDLGRSARDPVALERKSSWRFDLPELQDLNEKPVDYSSVVTAGSSTWGSRPGFTYVPKGQRPRAPPATAPGRRRRLVEVPALEAGGRGIVVQVLRPPPLGAGGHGRLGRLALAAAQQPQAALAVLAVVGITPVRAVPQSTRPVAIRSHLRRGEGRAA